jgi:hypothetical protein
LAQAAQARLDALENDHEPADVVGAGSEDDEFNMEEEEGVYRTSSFVGVVASQFLHGTVDVGV